MNALATALYHVLISKEHIEQCDAEQVATALVQLCTQLTRDALDDKLFQQASAWAQLAEGIYESGTADDSATYRIRN